MIHGNYKSDWSVCIVAAIVSHLQQLSLLQSGYPAVVGGRCHMQWLPPLQRDEQMSRI
jgi:hypothetical protein